MTLDRDLLRGLMRQGAPVVLARRLQKGENLAAANSFLAKNFGVLPPDIGGTIQSDAQSIISVASVVTAAIAGVFSGTLPEPPTVSGFNPDPERPSKYYYEVDVPIFVDDDEQTLSVTIRSDKSLSPSDLQDLALDEAFRRLQASPDGFGISIFDLDNTTSGEITVRGIWKTY